MINLIKKIRRRLFSQKLTAAIKNEPVNPNKLLAFLADKIDSFDEFMGWKWSIQNLIVTYTLQPIRRVLEWVKVSFQYSIFLWNNGYDWDFNSLILLLRFKLQRKYDFFTSSETHISESKEVSEQIGRVINLIDQYIDNDFTKEEDEALELKWGKSKMVFDRDVARAKDGSILGHRISFDVPNAKTEEDMEQFKKEQSETIELGFKRKDECWEAIWDAMKKSNWWWD